MVASIVDSLDHRAAGDERRHRIEQLASAVQHADTVGAQHLMPGERRIVDAERMKVDGLMRHRLAGVQQRQRARPPWRGRPARATGATAPVTLEWWLKATTFTRSSSCSESRSMRPSSVTPYQLQGGSGAPGQLLPRDQVGVVLELGGDDHVAGADGMVEAVVAQHIGDQIDRLGGVLGEHQLVRRRRRRTPRCRRGPARRRRWTPPSAGAHRGAPRRWTWSESRARRRAPAAAAAMSHRNPGTPTGFRRASPASGSGSPP